MGLHLTVSLLAEEMQISVQCLIQSFLSVGIVKTKFDVVTQIEKEILIRYMNRNKLGLVNRLSLQRKTKSTLNVSSISGRNKKVQVEVRKKCVYTISDVMKESDSDNVFSRKLEEESIVKNKYDTNKVGIFNNTLVRNPKKSVQFFIDTEESTALVSNDTKAVDSSDFDVLNTKYMSVGSDINDKVHGKLSRYISQDKKIGKTEITNNSVKSEVINCNVEKVSNSSVHALSNVSELKVKSSVDDYKLIRDRRHNSRTRFRGRSTGKIVKQKRNNNHNLYEDIENRLDNEENFYGANRLNKTKRKQSALVQGFSRPPIIQVSPRNIVIGEAISVLELSNKMSVKSSYMLKVMMDLGVVATVNQVLDRDTAQLVIEEMGHNVVIRYEDKLEKSIMDDFHSRNSIQDQKNYKNRAPIVTVMGHVDHGKTSLLDYIRSTKIAASELGGITQKIGAYNVNTSGGMITFLDTPGHEAFTSMRSRGIRLTDIVVLVVAADDGVMPQTVESVKQIRLANVPVIVAINKIDKSKINVDQIKQELSNYGLIPEEWGGTTQFINISAVSGIGINNLLDAIMLQSEILELRVYHSGISKSIVIESLLDKKRGPMVTVLVREGSLKCGNTVLCGTEYGRIRAMYNEYNCDIDSAGPSIPVQILGLSGIPDSGEIMVVVKNEKIAREVASYRKLKRRELNLSSKKERFSGENIFDNVGIFSKVCELNFVVKADTQGSVEVICESLKKLSTNKVVIKILSYSIGDVIEADFMFASSAKAIILCFNVKIDSSARSVVLSNNLDIRYYSVIYDLLDDVKKMSSQILEDKSIYYSTIGVAEVHNIFQSKKCGNIAGCIVTQGVIRSHKKIKIKRNNIIIYEGELESLRRFKNDVSEVKSGVECGIVIQDYSDIQSGDIIEVLDILE